MLDVGSGVELQPAFALQAPEGPEQRIGIVDLGSNTARLVVFAYRAGRWFRLVDSIREPIRLAAGMGKKKRLQPEAVERALGALKMFADYAGAVRLERFEVIATSGLRDAVNREQVTPAIRGMGLELSVLSGEEEAELGVTAVANGLSLDDAWVVDLGGGSVQLSVMRGRDFDQGQSFPLGSVRLTEAHLRRDPPTEAEVAELEAVVADRLGPSLSRLRRDRLPIVAMGGTVRNLARIAQRRSRYPLPLLHAYYLSRSGLEEVTSLLLARSRPRRRRLPGLNPDRADVIVAGALVFRWLLRESGREGLLISGYGVREGVFYRHFLPPPHRLTELRDFSVQRLFEQFPQPRLHTARVRFLSRRLFDGLEDLHGLTAADAELLDAAAVLHDIGTTIGYYRHHRHGAFLLNSAPLEGFSHREQALISLIVRYHRGARFPKLGPYRRLTQSTDPHRLKVLVTCLRLAEDLERSRSGRVEDVFVEIKNRRVQLVLRAREHPSVEISETCKHAGLFEHVFGRRLDIVAETALVAGR